MMEKTVVLHLKLEQWELAMGTAGNSAKFVQNDREEEQQGASEERIRLVVSGLPLGHEPSKTLAFSAEWIVNQEKLAVRKLSGARHCRDGLPSTRWKHSFSIKNTFRGLSCCGTNAHPSR